METYNCSNITVNNKTIRCNCCNVKGSNNTIYGSSNNIKGDNNTIEGGSNNIDGNNNKVRGHSNSVKGNNNNVIGKSNLVRGENNTGEMSMGNSSGGNFVFTNISGISNVSNFGNNSDITYIGSNPFSTSSIVSTRIGPSFQEPVQINVVQDIWEEVNPDRDEVNVDNERFSCIICYERMKNCSLEPCGHASFCSTCILEQKPTNCPLCRTEITKAKTLYF